VACNVGMNQGQLAIPEGAPAALAALVRACMTAQPTERPCFARVHQQLLEQAVEAGLQLGRPHMRGC
jgi:hypothetical protein